MAQSTWTDPPSVENKEEFIEKAIHKLFPECEHSEVREFLKGYKDDYEPRKIRVQLAILKLSKGNLDQLTYYIQEANMDYRDVRAI